VSDMAPPDSLDQANEVHAAIVALAVECNRRRVKVGAFAYALLRYGVKTWKSRRPDGEEELIALVRRMWRKDDAS
jgi:hypothetical protein